MGNENFARRLVRKFNRNAEKYTDGARKNDHRTIMPAADDLGSWEDCENGRLLGPMILVAGTAIHLEAIEVSLEDDGTMVIKNAADETGQALLDALEDEIDSAHDTSEFGGRHFVIYAAPAPARGEPE